MQPVRLLDLAIVTTSCARATSERHPDHRRSNRTRKGLGHFKICIRNLMATTFGTNAYRVCIEKGTSFLSDIICNIDKSTHLPHRGPPTSRLRAQGWWTTRLLFRPAESEP
ncbi:hypothetical protein FN846DRAFT_182478 [Sphaerosporella brunnea]|uniref:Uncharacterized protein n=1 Tax=Sphaerosporella brunnea TaxID=1250544 RepID=A0A5J5F808_9PEZI|nr:hypothetical protein FN846DRAFT_182478 [Sphaerosporella brunnea]